MAAIKDLVILKGETFSQPLRWEAPPIVWKAVTAIATTAPVSLSVPGHGCKPNWRIEVSSKKSMPDIDGVRGLATVVDPDTIEINTVNASGFKPYTGGGYISYNTPVDLTGVQARLTIKNKLGGVEQLSLTSANNGISLNVSDCTITLLIDASVTAALTWKSGVYDLELVSADGTVTRLLQGKVRVEGEITT